MVRKHRQATNRQQMETKKCRKVPPVFGGVLPDVSIVLSLKWYMPYFVTVSLVGNMLPEKVPKSAEIEKRVFLVFLGFSVYWDEKGFLPMGEACE